MPKKYFDFNCIDNERLNKVLNGLRHFNEDKYSEWFIKLPKLFDCYAEKYKLSDIRLADSGRLGLILFCHSDYFNEEVVLKIIPDYLNIFEIELSAYLKLPKIYMCPLLFYDNNDNILILKKLNSEKAFDFSKDKEKILEFFKIVDSNRILARDDDKKYIDILNEFYNSTKDYTLLYDYRHNLYDFIINLYKKYDNEKLFLIHGDLHSGNVLIDKDKFLAIDPLGYAAPYIFTFARLVNVNLLYSLDIESTYQELISFLTPFVKEKDFIPALVIDNYCLLCTLVYELKNGEKIIYRVQKVMDKLLEKLKGDV